MFTSTLPVRLLMLAACALSVARAAPCDNPLKPVRSGWVWNYRVTPTGKAPTGYRVSRQAQGGGYLDTVLTPEQPQQAQTYRCDGGAHIIVSPPTMKGLEFTKASFSGVSIPAAPSWKAGYAWDSGWTLEGRQGLLSGKGTFGSSARIVGREQVSVPAGSFEAWRVEIRSRVDAQMGPIPFHQSFAQTQWFVEGVGLVRAQDGRGLTELLSLQK
ncbi:hypothetical protein [Deinococcus sp.]|uniref:TapB family protein n=1 Tax=Deinococcus sp. TaxID=47478 RepID=UPI003CC6D042